MKALYDAEARTLTIYVRPGVAEGDTIDYGEGTVAPVPLRITTGTVDDVRGYAVRHVWSDIDLEEMSW